MEDITIKELKSRMWYRMLKVFYMLLSILIIIYSWIIFKQNSTTRCYSRGGCEYDYEKVGEQMFYVLLVMLIAYFFVSRIFYYIYFGTLKPLKK